MRPRPIPRKTPEVARRPCGGPAGFNEAAADTAENDRHDAAVRVADHTASMRPRPIPRKTAVAEDGTALLCRMLQ